MSRREEFHTQRLVGYHASTSPTLQPRDEPLHIGTEQAAEDRAHWGHQPGPWYLHEVEWEGPVARPTTDKAANFAGMGDTYPREEINADLLRDHRQFGAPKPRRELGRVGRALRVQGAAVPYTNSVEDEGSTSYVVPNSRSVKVRRTERLY